MQQREKFTDFFDLMVNNGFLPKIAFPTRLSSHSASILDQMYIKTKISTVNKSHTGIIYSSVSDHFAYFTCFQFDNNSIGSPKYVTIERNDEDSMNAFIYEISSANIIDQLDKSIVYDPNKTYGVKDNIIQNAKLKHMPTKTVKFNKYKHKKTNWITQGILKSIHFKDKLYAQLNSCPKFSPRYQLYKANFTTYSNMLKKTIREAKKKYYYNEFQKYKNNICQSDKNQRFIFMYFIHNYFSPTE